MRKRIHPRPRMNVRETDDEEGTSWSLQVTMVLRDMEAIIGERPGNRCNLNIYHRNCEACSEVEEWDAEAIRIVGEATDRTFYAYSSGPGRRFASEPSIYCIARRPYLLRIYWHGGLDI